MGTYKCLLDNNKFHSNVLYLVCCAQECLFEKQIKLSGARLVLYVLIYFPQHISNLYYKG